MGRVDGEAGVGVDDDGGGDAGNDDDDGDDDFVNSSFIFLPFV